MWCNGWPSRLAFGTMWLGALGASGYGRGLLPALPLATLAATLGGICGRRMRCNDISQSGSSWWMFTLSWSGLLGRLSALGGGARVLAATLDSLAGGKPNRWLFGGPALPPGSEPWPDPLAVTALALLCLMMMCGLENSSTLTVVLITSVISGVIFFVGVGSIGADLPNWEEQRFFPEGLNGMILAAGCCTYGFPEALPLTDTNLKKLKCLGLIIFPLFCMMTIGLIYSMISPFREYSESVVPLVQIFETHRPPWAQPVMASFTVVSMSLAMTEILPQAVATLLMMAGSDWKVLTRVLMYESSTTGSPVLAVFSAGSLSAILAFACPLSHLIKLTCATQVFVWILEAGTLLHLQCQPEHMKEDAIDVQYKRLAGTQARPLNVRPTRGARLAAGLWFLPRSVRQAVPSESTKIHKSIGEDRECLLLDEYGVATTGNGESDHSEQSDLSDHKEEYTSDGESSTDIDAVVKEYKDRITVVSSVPDSSGVAGLIPTAASGKRGTAGAIIFIMSCFLFAIGITTTCYILIYITIPMIISGALICWWQPKRPMSISIFTCISCALICAILATPLLADAWPAIILFLTAGYIMYARRSVACSGIRRHSHRPPPLLGPRPARITHLDTVYIGR